MGIKTYPSKLIYSIDVPEVTNFRSIFFYNYFMTDESINDSGVISDLVVKKMNISKNLIQTIDSFTPDYDIKSLQYDLKKVPRYVVLRFSPPSNKNVKLSNFIESDSNKNLINFLKENSSKIVSEDDFSSSGYTAVNIDNGNIDKQTTNLLQSIGLFVQSLPDPEKIKYLSNLSNLSENGISNINKNFPFFLETSKIYYNESNPSVITKTLSSQILQNGAFFKNNIKNPYFNSLKAVTFDSQIKNNILFDLFIQASGSYHFNNQKFLDQLNYAAATKIFAGGNDNFDLSDDNFKPSIPFYQKELSSNFPASERIVGYIIDKFEFITNGETTTINKNESIFINNGVAKNYVDLKVRYGAAYVYKIKTVMEITYNALVSETMEFAKVKSLISSKPVTTYVETFENVAPPPPSELKFSWDYDRYNPNTALFDHQNNKVFSNTGVRGSLFISWSLPINTQLDIKKIQLFRRKSINEPFELIKVFDFDDSDIKFQNLENNISAILVQSTYNQMTKKFIVPKSYYDDDFMKNSEYIYALASIDAHGLASNYSEQFKVTFDKYENKLAVSLVSIAGALKQYPNLYIQGDLFVDTIKTTNKNTLKVYFNPKCYYVDKNGTIQNVINMKSSNINDPYPKYLLNFINIDNQKNAQLKIILNDKTK